MAFSVPAAALADCTSYGGSGTWGASITPSSQTFSNLNDYKSLSINNIGTNSWSINSWQLPIGFTNNDPNGCFWKTYAGGQSCSISVRPTAYGSAGNFSVTTSGGVNPFAYLDGPDSAPGTWGASVTPTSQTFSNLVDSKPFTVKNTGTSQWTVQSPQLEAGFTYSDPNGCVAVGKTYTAGQTCVFWIRPTTYAAEGSFWINTNGGVSPFVFLDAPNFAPYVALGDSYSAGTGTNTGSYADNCRRTTYAYPERVVASRPNVRLTFKACHGAKTTDVLNTQIPTTGSPLNRDTRWVSITIGGNDAGFSNVLKDCAFTYTDAVCLSVIESTKTFIRTSIPWMLRNTYARIKAQAPYATVVVLSYPRLFPSGSCATSLFSTTEMTKLNETADLLREVTRTETAGAGSQFRFKDSTNLFAGHDICSSTEWVRGVVIDPFSFDKDDSFHPNRAGHEAYAGLAREVIN
jgi:hypothetical protein